MDQLEFFDIPSPCIGVCQSGGNGFCIGCFRSREERLHWTKLPSDVKRQINRACIRRKKRAAQGKSIPLDDLSLPKQQDLWAE